jgi:hypothetical protein
VEGTWTFRADMNPESPDSTGDERFRLAFLTDSGESPGGALRVVAPIPAGTAREPQVWIAPRAFDRLWLGIARQREPSGQVRYRIERHAPEGTP